jgi:hypothetical protein
VDTTQWIILAGGFFIVILVPVLIWAGRRRP